ncbi:MAG: glycosyltransferase [Bryobacterales bacterium]|nr:glycosyltransferase [Bryobacterales bacterium]
MSLLWFLVLLAALLALLSLRGDAAKARFWAQPLPALAAPPPVTLIVPVKGHDEGLRDNLAALAAQDYPDFELIVCARAPEDIPAGVVPAGARVVYSHAPDPHTGEKIQNLLAAIAAARPASTVLAFADSDARPLPHWLRALTAAALDPTTGVATGYRWYIPERGFASHLRSAWNSVIAGGYGPAPAAFCWGGAMAVRRELFERLAIRDAWRAQVSDDYVMSARVRDAGLRIAFVPGALTPARDHTSIGELLDWSARQLLLTRVYRPELWRLALFAHVVYCAALPAAAVLALNGHAAALAPLALQLAIGMTKAARRVRWASAALGQPAGSALLHAALAPAATWLWLHALLASSFGDILAWRGVRYRLSREGCERLG